MSIATKIMYKKSTVRSFIEIRVSFPLQYQLIPIVTKLCLKNPHPNISMLVDRVFDFFSELRIILILALPNTMMYFNPSKHTAQYNTPDKTHFNPLHSRHIYNFALPWHKNFLIDCATSGAEKVRCKDTGGGGSDQRLHEIEVSEQSRAELCARAQWRLIEASWARWSSMEAETKMIFSKDVLMAFWDVFGRTAARHDVL